VQAQVLNILKICKDHGVACAGAVDRESSVETRIEQGFEIVLTPAARSFEHLNKGLRKVGRLA